MKKILIANDMLKGGGVENVLENLVNYLLNHNYEVSLYIPDCKQQDAEEVFGKGIKVFPHVRSLKYIRQFTIRWLWDRGKYVVETKLIHWKMSHEYFDVLIALKEGPIMKELSHIRSIRKYAWVHTDYRYMHWTEGYFRSTKSERKCMEKYDRVICVSNSAKESVIEIIGDPGNLCVKYNPLDHLNILTHAKQECMMTKETSGLLFLSVGRLTKQKNYEMLLDVCEKLQNDYEFELWIIGDGRERNELEKILLVKDIRCVKLLGNQVNPYNLMNKADVYVSSATWESFGISIQEALILGIPVITTDCPAIREVFDTRFGMLVDNSFQSVYKAMEKMIVDLNLRESYKNNIEKFYDRESLYENRLKSICALWEESDE